MKSVSALRSPRVQFTSPVELDRSSHWILGSAAACLVAVGWFGTVLGVGQPVSATKVVPRSVLDARLEAQNRERADAYAAAQTFVESRYRRLSSVSYPSLDDESVAVREVEPDVWFVKGYVTTHDVYGATKRPGFATKLCKQPNGAWQVRSMCFSGASG